MSVKNEQINKDSGFKIMGISPLAFAIIAAVVLGASYMEVLPAGMVGAFPLMIVLGAILNDTR